MYDNMSKNYIKSVIKPTEKIKKELQSKVVKKGIFASKYEKDFLQKYENLLFEQYSILEKMMMDE